MCHNNTQNCNGSCRRNCSSLLTLITTTTLNKFSFELNAISSAEIYFAATVAVVNNHCMLAHFAARSVYTHTCVNINLCNVIMIIVIVSVDLICVFSQRKNALGHVHTRVCTHAQHFHHHRCQLNAHGHCMLRAVHCCYVNLSRLHAPTVSHHRSDFNNISSFVRLFLSLFMSSFFSVLLIIYEYTCMLFCSSDWLTLTGVWHSVDFSGLQRL